MAMGRCVALTVATFAGLLIGLPAIPQPTTTPLSITEKNKLLWEAKERAVPRGGRWVWRYRMLGLPRSEEVVVWDSEESPKQGLPEAEVPCWLPVVLSLSVEGLVDGDGAPYSGPLFANVHGGQRHILGPYPEGFVCCIDGKCRVDLLADKHQFQPYTSIDAVLYYRVPYAFEIILPDGPWPSDPDGRVNLPPDVPPDEFALAPQCVWFRPVAFEGNEFSQVSSTVAAGLRHLRVEVRYVLPSGRPAARLPVRFQWYFTDARDLPEQGAMHDAETGPDGTATDSIHVPANIVKGWVHLLYHTTGDEYGTATTRQFDFGQAGE